MRAAKANSIRGLYIHVPFCDGKCHYCAFYSVPYHQEMAERWLAALAREMQPWHGLAPATIYIGGGTPSLLSLAQWEKLAALMQRVFKIKHGIEWTVEINPATLNRALLQRMVADSVNRISIGAQSFCDHELTLLGRRHSAADIFRTVAMVKEVGIKNFNLDLIAGIPGSTLRTFQKTLVQAVNLKPAHISVYALTMEESTRLARLAVAGVVQPLAEDQQLAALHLAENFLTRASYTRYEISNYARRGFACRHNLDCWRGECYLGFGPAAASHVGMKRWQNVADIKAYCGALEQGRLPPREEEIITVKTKRIERLIFGLRMREGVPANLADSKQRRALRQLAREGLLQFRNRRWQLTARGRDLADYVAVELLDGNN